MYKSRAFYAAVALVSAGLLASSAEAAATFYNLGTLDGTANSAGYGVNDAGQVAGDSYNNVIPNVAYHAIRYSGIPGSGGAMLDLGTLGAAYGRAAAINAAGDVAGESST